METGVFWDLESVSDAQLRSGLTSLLANGYRTEARIIAHIAEVEERKLHAKDGSPSLFEYCVKQLGLSESEATGEHSAHAEPPMLALASPPPASPPRAPARATVEPTSEARYRIQLNASSSLKEKLELFQALVSHSIPNGDVAAVLERALDLALEQVQKQRFAKTDMPRNRRKPRGIKLGSRGSHREHVPNAVQRQVATRDGLRCTYVSDGGCRCSARAFLQIHHEQPWARGGAPVAENLRLLCAVHNRLLAERDFGAAHVAERLAARRGRHARATDAESGCSQCPARSLHRHDGAPRPE
jgi:hypothetical protein